MSRIQVAGGIPVPARSDLRWGAGEPVPLADRGLSCRFSAVRPPTLLVGRAVVPPVLSTVLLPRQAPTYLIAVLQHST